MGRILGIDYGKRYVGFSISDPKGIIAKPLKEIDLKRKDFFKELNRIIEEYSPSEIVIGNPLSLSGKPLELSEQIKKIKDKIEKKFKIKVVLWDERFTSKLAEQHKNNKIHAISSAYILQNYLDYIYNRRS